MTDKVLKCNKLRIKVVEKKEDIKKAYDFYCAMWEEKISSYRDFKGMVTRPNMSLINIYLDEEFYQTNNIEETPIGIVMIRRIANQELRLESIIIWENIRTSLRRLGIGQSVLIKILESFKWGWSGSELVVAAQYCFLCVETQNIAQNLYKRIGFKKLSYRPNFFADGRHAYLMELALDDKFDMLAEMNNRYEITWIK